MGYKAISPSAFHLRTSHIKSPHANSTEINGICEPDLPKALLKASTLPVYAPGMRDQFLALLGKFNTAAKIKQQQDEKGRGGGKRRRRRKRKRTNKGRKTNLMFL